MDDLRGSRSAQEFFHEAVTSALRHQDLSLAEMTEFYLVNLLAEYVHTTSSIGAAGDEPLAIKLCQASQTTTLDERLRLLKDVGDESLYVSGFFAERLERGLVDSDYYINLGGVAYGQASTLMRIAPNGDRFGGIFAELAEKFARVVDVLAEISVASRAATPAGLLRLYERWIRNRHEPNGRPPAWLERTLRAHGFLSGDEPDGYVH